MKTSETISLLRAKIARILGLLLLVRLCLYIPVPNVDLDIFSQGQVLNPLFGFAKTLTGSSFLGLGSLGILPYINASIIVHGPSPRARRRIMTCVGVNVAGECGEVFGTD